MKSAYELAMERLEKEQGKATPVSEKQKAAIAEIDRRAKASLAEQDILFGEKIVTARARGDFEEIRKLEAELRAEKDRIRDRAESEKDAVRRDESLA